jgi:hypothetical protein
MKILILIILFPAIASAQYFEPFTTQDYVLQSIYTAVTVIDWAQTKDFVSQGIEERNIILGKYPSQDRIDILIFSAIVVHGLITYALPRKYRFYWQSPWIVTEYVAVCYTKYDMELHGYKLTKNPPGNCEGAHKIEIIIKF